MIKVETVTLRDGSEIDVIRDVEAVKRWSSDALARDAALRMKIASLRRALGFARPFVVGASEGRGRWAMAAGGAIAVMDSAMIAADINTGAVSPLPQSE